MNRSQLTDVDHKGTLLMTTTLSRATTARKWIVAAIVLVLLAAAAAAANPITQAVSGRSIGALMAEQSGRVRYDRYDRTGEVPPGVLPVWFPTNATAVTVVQPGPKPGSGGSLRVDAVVPDALRLPSDCLRSTALSVPFPLPSDWPHYALKDLHTCGAWTVFARADHLFLWREPPAAH